MASVRRFLSLLMILTGAVLLSACSDATNPTGPGDDDPNGSGGGTTTEFDSQAPPGDSARAFLDDRQFTVLRVEVDYMEGYPPTGDGLDSLKVTLDARLSKSSVELRSPNSIPAAGQNDYSADEIRDLEEQHRDHYTRAESDTLWAYMLVVDGEFTEANVLGIAYYNTSMAFFGETIEEVSQGVGAPRRYKVEGTVFRHEFGHNFGLVNNGIPMQEDHHDAENGAHCDKEQCVMYYTVRTTDFFSNLFDGTIPEFEQFCREDMRAQGGQ